MQHESTSSSCSESSSGSDCDEGQSRPVRRELKLTMLQSLHNLDAEGDRSCYAENGISVKRIKHVLRNPPCECKCRVPFNILQQACHDFWGLPKSAQDALLWSLQANSGQRSRSTWSIEGHSLFIASPSNCANLSAPLTPSVFFRT